MLVPDLDLIIAVRLDAPVVVALSGLGAGILFRYGFISVASAFLLELSHQIYYLEPFYSMQGFGPPSLQPLLCVGAFT